MNDFFLADDLSGALEVAAAYHNAGRTAVVTWNHAGWEKCGPEVVVGFDTESRNLPAAEAAEAVTRALALAKARGGRLLFKKIDSTMRGPVAAEVAALAQAMPEAAIVFTPANPHAGRVVRDGTLFVQGVPVAETDFGRDPANPVKESSIRPVVPRGAEGRVHLVDAKTDADLIEAIRLRAADLKPWVAIGSGALARVLAPQQASGASARPPPPVVPTTPVLLVCGSAHPMNRTQAAKLTAARDVKAVEVNPSAVNPAVQAAMAAIRAGGAAALHIAPRSQPGADVDSNTALASIAQAAAKVAAESGARRVMATGGETARALCEIWKIEALRVLGDIEPGLVLAAGEGSAGNWLLAIKPGGFGDAETWIRAADSLRNWR